VSRDDERTAFARACAYLNYKAAAKWTAYVSAVLTALLFIALLVLLALFADVIVHRGLLPDFRDLTPDVQERVLADWRELSEEDRVERLEVAGFKVGTRTVKSGKKEETQKRVVRPGEEGEEPRPVTPWSTDLTSLDPNVVWRAELHRLLAESVSTEASDHVRGEEDRAAHGVLSLAAYSKAQGRLYAPLIGWLASWNPWMWRSASEFALVSPYLLGLFLLAVVIAIARAGLTLLMHEMAARSSIEAATRLRRAAYHHTFRLGTLAFRALGPSEAVTVFTRHVEAVHDALYLRLTSQFKDLVTFGVLLLFALLVNPVLALAFLLFAVLVWVIGGQVAAWFRRQGRLATNEASERLTLIRESLMLMRLVKCYMMELFNQSRVERQLARHARAQQQRFRGEAFYRPLLVFLGALASFCLLYVAGLIVLRGFAGVGSIIAMTTALLSLYWPLERWLANRRIMKRGREAALQVFRFLDRPSELGQVVGAEFLPALEKRLEFDNVSLREPGSGRMLLQNITLSIRAGQRIGLVGPDELEKHAFVYLIPRLLDPTSGEIRIDEHNLRWVTLDSLRDKIALVMMHDLVFHDSVANNIGCGDPSYTLPRIIEAAKMARAHQFIQKLPKGYETVVGELGHALTASQKYRIALARAIIRDPSLLIIEEPEEQLDDETKDLLDDALARFLPGRTVIFLPHRVPTIRSCDRIFLLHNGRVEAAGIHKELLAQNRLYRHLHYIEFNEMAEVV
jgi:ATP-binding cassette, subfamily B, bacterial